MSLWEALIEPSISPLACIVGFISLSLAAYLIASETHRELTSILEEENRIIQEELDERNNEIRTSTISD